MSDALDHSRLEVFGTDQVLSSSGRPRPKITPTSRVLIHYVGAGRSWLDAGDTPAEIRSIQDWAVSQNKPWEYNAVVDSAGETWEYSGEYWAAHNGTQGDFSNGGALGVLCLHGLADLPEDVALKFVGGIRKFCRQAIAAGWLTPDFDMVPGVTISRHKDERIGGTSCPGPLGDAPWWPMITAPLNTTEEDDDMKIIEQYRAADTRVWPGVKLEPQKVYRFNAGEGVPKAAKAMMATLTVTQTEGNGHIAVASPGRSMPTSSLNYATGQTIANTTLVPLVNGQYDLKSVAATHLVVDVLAYI
jgi:hypothetical protein